MDFDSYQAKAIQTDLFYKADRDINSKAFIAKLLGLVGETGEIAEKFKKIYRDKNGEMSEDQFSDMKKELGDVLWYVSTLSTYLGFNLSDVANTNIKKLASRSKRDKLRGSGDNR